jgi:hypothetical protein
MTSWSGARQLVDRVTDRRLTVSNSRQEYAGPMDLMIVCGSPDPGAGAYAVGAVLGLMLDLAMWARHRRLARRSAARQMLPLK